MVTRQERRLSERADLEEEDEVRLSVQVKEALALREALCVDISVGGLSVLIPGQWQGAFEVGQKLKKARLKIGPKEYLLTLKVVAIKQKDAQTQEFYEGSLSILPLCI